MNVKFLKIISVSVSAVFITILCLAATARNDIDLQGAKLLKTYPGGTRKYLLADGSKAIIWKDGSSRRAMRDGTVIHTWPDKGGNEIRRVINTDGTIESDFSDGTKKTTMPDGSSLWILPDGMQRKVKSDGTIWESTVPRQDIVDPEVVMMSPWPQRVEPGDRVVFSGKIMPGYADPWACVILPSGGMMEIGADSFIRHGAKFSVPVIMNDGLGIYRIEIIVRGKLGNRVALNVTIFAGIDPGEEDTRPILYKTIDPIEPLHKLEGKFLLMINRERKKRDIYSIKWDNETALLARHMAREWAYEGRIGHVSSKHGNIARRAAGLFKWDRIVYGYPPPSPDKDSPNYIADDIAKARSMGGAMATLLESPAHRRVILSSSWTHAGVGMSRIKGGDGRDVIIVIAMLQLNRPKHRKVVPKRKNPGDKKEDEIYKIYGRP